MFRLLEKWTALFDVLVILELLVQSMIQSMIDYSIGVIGFERLVTGSTRQLFPETRTRNKSKLRS